MIFVFGPPLLLIGCLLVATRIGRLVCLVIVAAVLWQMITQDDVGRTGAMKAGASDCSSGCR